MQYSFHFVRHRRRIHNIRWDPHQHGLAMGPKHRRRIHVANLDPAAEHFRYDVSFDVRDLISVDDVMEELRLGPNGSLVYCMEYLLQNMDWLEENLDNYDDDE